MDDKKVVEAIELYSAYDSSVSRIFSVFEEKRELIVSAIETIRKDAELGRGSCSSVDECQTDEELAAELAGNLFEHPRLTVTGLVAEVRRMERIRRSVEDDIRNS